MVVAMANEHAYAGAVAYGLEFGARVDHGTGADDCMAIYGRST